MHVDRCICVNVTLAQLKAYASGRGAGFEELRARFGCGRGCGLCIPYIRRMLETGETRIALGQTSGTGPRNSGT